MMPETLYGIITSVGKKSSHLIRKSTQGDGVGITELNMRSKMHILSIQDISGTIHARPILFVTAAFIMTSARFLS